MEGMILNIVNEELIPLIAEGVGGGFLLGTVFALASWGIFKAISLLGIENK